MAPALPRDLLQGEEGQVLRITRSTFDGGRVTLVVHGRLAAGGVGTLEAESLACLDRGAEEINLDFSDVIYVDWDGVELIRSLQRRGIRIMNCPSVILGALETS
jgi:hypothetical protein